tara:strand:+ start:140 stop:1474 length:1335 start_codon:yes stop_codon:yes gene_type:complete
MNLTVVGAGYVGLVTAACFSEMGNNVVCVDVDERKLAGLENGRMPIHEPGLGELIAKNFSAKRLVFQSKLSEIVNETDIVFIAVGTPPKKDGSVDLSQVLDVAKQIGESLLKPIVVAHKSTVPVGTAQRVKKIIDSEIEKREARIEFDVVSNPEFLKEGSAVNDFMYPDRIVVGADSEKGRKVMEELYAPFSKKLDRIQCMGLRDAEMVKYASNAMLATKISVINEVAAMCDYYGIDVENVRKGVGADPRIGSAFIYPGCGYGGSCFPKDISAMIKMSEAAGVESSIFSAVEDRNKKQQELLFEKILEYFGGKLLGRKFAVWGLAFKPETDDVRFAPSLRIIRRLCERGCELVVYDPEARTSASEHLSDLEVTYVDNQYLATRAADALVVVTEWREFKQPDFKKLKIDLKSQVIFDGRNIYDPFQCLEYGLTYVGIGRSSSLYQ